MTGERTRTTVAADDVVVRIAGHVDDDDRAYAQEKVAHVARVAPRPVRFAKVELRVEPDPARDRPAVVTNELDVDGRVVRARAEAPTVHEAIDLAEARLRITLERLAHHVPSERRRHRDRASWHHGDPVGPRPEYFPRPAAEREVIVRKTHGVPATTPEDAELDLELLDDEFVLFRDDATGADCVVARSDGGVRLITDSQAEVLSTDEAAERLDASGEPFVFFRLSDTARGHVLYRRYDGHYGLVEPADL
jgi:ribosome-associated translation inhibitor RaiA